MQEKIIALLRTHAPTRFDDLTLSPCLKEELASASTVADLQNIATDAYIARPTRLLSTWTDWIEDDSDADELFGDLVEDCFDGAGDRDEEEMETFSEILKLMLVTTSVRPVTLLKCAGLR